MRPQRRPRLRRAVDRIFILAVIHAAWGGLAFMTYSSGGFDLTPHILSSPRTGLKKTLLPRAVGSAGSSDVEVDGAETEVEDKGSHSATAWPLIVALCAVGIFISYADRSNISVAVISMAQEFSWSKTFEGVVLSAFFGGYAATQLLGGQLADVIGGKVVLAFGLSLWSLATFLTPAAAAAGSAQLLLTRILLGLGEGVAFPSVHSIIARAVPRSKQSSAVSIVTAAAYAGAALAFLVVPSLIQQYGWRMSFESFGAAALLWLPFWLSIELPARKQANQAKEPAIASAEAALRELVPLLKRKEVIAICVAQYTGSWGLYGLISWLPTFFSEQYGVPLADLPALTFLPYALQAAVGLWAGNFADAAISSGRPALLVRKGFQTTGMLVPALMLIAAASPLAAGSPTLGALFIDVGLAASALTLAGVSANHLDVAPRHAGAVFGAGNTFGTLAGLLAVPVTGFILDMTHSWSIVFGVTAAHYIIGAALFAMWAGASPLEEDFPPDTLRERETTKV